MPKRKEPELDPNEQAKRFREAAKEAEVDADAAERAFEKLSGGSNRRRNADCDKR